MHSPPEATSCMWFQRGLMRGTKSMPIPVRKFLLMVAAASLLPSMFAIGQRTAPPDSRPRGREDALDPSPVNPATDPDVNMFVNDWHNATSRAEYGKLAFH